MRPGGPRSHRLSSSGSTNRSAKVSWIIHNRRTRSSWSPASRRRSPDIGSFAKRGSEYPITVRNSSSVRCHASEIRRSNLTGPLRVPSPAGAPHAGYFMVSCPARARSCGDMRLLDRSDDRVWFSRPPRTAGSRSHRLPRGGSGGRSSALFICIACYRRQIERPKPLLNMPIVKQRALGVEFSNRLPIKIANSISFFLGMTT
jgi:hypothetical protein